MAPIALPAGFDAPWEPSAGYTMIPEGFYSVSIFDAELKNKNGNDYYVLTLRIDGGDNDGDDLQVSYVGLTPKTVFRLYEILEAAGVINTYYNAGTKTWIAFPDKGDLEGLQFQVQVENDPFISKKDGQVQYNSDGTVKVRDAARPTRFFPLKETGMTFKKTIKPLDLSQVGGGASSGGGVPSVPAVPGAPVNGSDTTPW